MNLIKYEDFQRTSTFFVLKPCNIYYGFILVVFSLVLSFFVWASFFKINEVVSADILLRPDSLISSIKNISSGEVVFINYENGKYVEEGDLLLSLDTKPYEIQLEMLYEELAEVEKKIEINNFLEKTVIDNAIPEECSEYDSLTVCQDYLNQKKIYELDILYSDMKIQREEDKPKEIKIPIELEDLILENKKIRLNYNNYVSGIKKSIINNKENFYSEKKNIDTSISSLERTIKNSKIYASVSGNILEILKINKGDNIVAGSELFKIIPNKKGSLKAELYVSPSDIAKIKNGNSVVIKFPGLPPSRYGQIKTEISFVPPDVTLSSEGTNIFTVEAQIEEPYLWDRDGKQIILVPGIMGKAKIVTDSSSVLQMILKKLDFMY